MFVVTIVKIATLSYATLIWSLQVVKLNVILCLIMLYQINYITNTSTFTPINKDVIFLLEERTFQFG